MYMTMNSAVASFEDSQLSKLSQFLEVTGMQDVEAAVQVLKSFNWDIEKAIDEHLLDSLDNLSTSSSSASDFVIIDRNNLSNTDLNNGLLETPGIIDDAGWKAAPATSLPDEKSDSDDSCEVISKDEGTGNNEFGRLTYADAVNGNTGKGGDNDDNDGGGGGDSEQKVSFLLGGSPISTGNSYMEQDD